jgi:hypothetical protein
MPSRTPLENAFRDYMRAKMFVITSSRGEVANDNSKITTDEFLSDKPVQYLLKGLLTQCLKENPQDGSNYNEDKRVENMKTMKRIKFAAYDVKEETDTTQKLLVIENLESLLKKLYKDSGAIVLSDNTIKSALNAYKIKNAPQAEANGPTNTPPPEAIITPPEDIITPPNKPSNNSKQNSYLKRMSNKAKGMYEKLKQQAGGSMSRKTKKSKKRRGTKKRK